MTRHGGPNPPVTDYHKQLFDEYGKRIDVLDAEGGKVEFFRWYAERYYRPHMAQLPLASLQLLDIGCNRGYLLKVFDEWGMSNLHGIDLSPQDVEIAHQLIPSAQIHLADAFEYLPQHPATYDLIITKATLEHIAKAQVIPFLKACAAALKPAGLLIVDVPNMDWLGASHERYMDFTHEVGFTPQSLQQVMGQAFADIQILPADNHPPHWKRRLARAFLGWLLHKADPEIASNPIWARSLIGVGRGSH